MNTVNAIILLNLEMTELKNIMTQLVSMQARNAAVTARANQQPNQQLDQNRMVDTEVISNDRSHDRLPTTL